MSLFVPGQQPLDITLPYVPTPVQRNVAVMVWPKRGGVCPTCRRPRARPFAQLKPDTRGQRDHSGWRREIEAAVSAVWRGSPKLNGPLRMRTTFVLPRPKSRPTVSKTSTRTVDGNKIKIDNPRHLGGHFIVSKEAWAVGNRVLAPRIPDLDRLINSLKDCLTACGVWHDDAQVAMSSESKWYAAVGEEPMIRVRVSPA